MSKYLAPHNYVESMATENTATSDTCPSCDAAISPDGPEIPKPVCSECGFVLDAEVPPELDQVDKEEGPTGPDSWVDYRSVTNSTEKQIAVALERVEGVGEELLLSNEIKAQVADVYESVAIENLTDGRPTGLVVAACICIGSRETETPRPSERIAQAMELNPQRLKRTIRIVQEELNRGYTGESPSEYVSYLCTDVGLDNTVESEASGLANRFAEQTQIAGKHPAGIAGAAVYLAASGAVTQRQMASVAGVTKETIRVRVADLQEACEK